jgi:glycosyltransferase involved in cell wall biosynthesis/SAM-dependent methyltransferase
VPEDALRSSHPQPRRCLSVVIPCYNESATIESIIGRVLQSPWTEEIIVVDDASADDSAAIVARLEEPRVRLLRQPKNQGKGAALRRGFLEATAEYVVVQDADNEYDPADYSALLEPLEAGQADVVFGSRFHTDKAHRVLYFWHSLGNKLLTLLSNMTTDLNLTDMETCYKAFRREIIQSIDIEEDRFGFEPEVTAKVAAAGYRVFEVGITYDGRTYDEGKKIGWKDGVRALYCIARYAKPFTKRQLEHEVPLPAAFEEADSELAGTLDSLDGADNYNRWIVDQFAPYLRGEICELGAGHGTMTGLLAEHGRVVACDPSPRCARALEERYGGDERIEVVKGDFASAAEGRQFDAVVLINVLEHIEDDQGLLQSICDRLKPGGHVLVFAPALPSLYSDFDRKIGHHRRYRRSTLVRRMFGAKLEVVESRYMNSIGVAAWWLVTKKLGRTPTSSGPVSFYDRVVIPWLRKVEDGRRLPIGQSLVVVGARPAD